MKNQTPKTAPAAVELACIQCGAPYPALPGGSGLCPACAKKAARTAVCAKCGRPFALPRLPARTAHKGSARAIFWRYGQKAAAPQAEGPGGKLGALLADLDKENARRGKKGLLPLSYGKYVQLFGR